MDQLPIIQQVIPLTQNWLMYFDLKVFRSRISTSKNGMIKIKKHEIYENHGQGHAT